MNKNKNKKKKREGKKVRHKEASKQTGRLQESIIMPFERNTMGL